MPFHVLLEVVAAAALELAALHLALVRTVARVTRLVALEMFLALEGAAAARVAAFVLLVRSGVDEGRDEAFVVRRRLGGGGEPAELGPCGRQPAGCAGLRGRERVERCSVVVGLRVQRRGSGGRDGGRGRGEGVVEDGLVGHA